MIAALKWNLLSIEDYLAGELQSPIKHEYLGGVVYAMAGARNTHNLIEGNIFAIAHARLRGNRCRPWNSNTKIRIQLPSQIRFYYPDNSINCEPNPPDDSFQDKPVIIFEVILKNTRRIDEGEKKDAYLTIPSLAVYALVEQETAAIVAFRRTPAGFVREVHAGLDAVLPLPEVQLDLPLAEIYEGVTFTSEAVNEEG